MAEAPLPGHEIVDAGLEDLRAGRWTASAFAVLEARPRLERAGATVPDVAVERPSHRLYVALEAEDPATAHGRHTRSCGGRSATRGRLSVRRDVDAD